MTNLILTKYNYVYLTTNLIDGKQYVGDRGCNCEPSKDKYLGSGTYYKRAENLYGKQNFKKEILELFTMRLDAFNAQEKYIKQYHTLVSEGGYNISPMGGNNVNRCHSKETKQRISEANKIACAGKKMECTEKNILKKRNKIGVKKEKDKLLQKKLNKK